MGLIVWHAVSLADMVDRVLTQTSSLACFLAIELLDTLTCSSASSQFLYVGRRSTCNSRVREVTA